MKLIFNLTALIIAFSTFGQNPEIDFLKLKRDQLKNLIDFYNDSLKQLDGHINTAYLRTFESGNSMSARLKGGADVKDSTDPSAKVIGKFNAGDTVRLYAVKWYHYLASKDNIKGYIPVKYIEETFEIRQFYDAMSKKEIQDRLVEYDNDLKSRQKQNELQREAENLKIRATRKKVIEKRFAKYGSAVVGRIIEGKYWIGMTDEMAIYSIGSPSKVNSTVTASSRDEQWVYSNDLYLYFENGILVTYQNSR